MTTTLHHDYMTHALELAERGRFTVAPNPMVGCVLIKNGNIIGLGYHQRAGGPHAEIIALQAAGEAARGATAYVTLEPCCHHGRTPPCTDALIKAGVCKVYVAVNDPNPLMAGKGIAILQTAGIEVITNIAVTAASKLNAIFFHYIRHKKPFVFAKWALSLDGKTITHPEDTRDISGQETQWVTHALRRTVDAIIIGARTAIHDNPQLTARCSPEPITRQPLRIVLTSKGILPTDLKLFDQTHAKTLIATTAAIQPHQLDFYRAHQLDVLILPHTASGQIDLSILLAELGKREISSVLVEGGMTLLESFFEQQLINKTHVYIAPVIIGKHRTKQYLSPGTITKVGTDIHFSADHEDMTHV